MDRKDVCRSTTVRLLTAVSLLLWLVGRAGADNVTVTTANGGDVTESGKLAGEGPVPPSEKTLLPIYRMAELFLESVITPGRLAELNDTQNLTTFRAALHSAQNDWQNWLRHYWSYSVCLAVAAAYVVVFPVVGCAICGCRGAGRCLGGARAKRGGKSWHWYRRVCGFSLLLLAVGLLFGVIGMFLATTMVHERTRADGVPRTLADGLRNFDLYLDRAKDSYAAGGRHELRLRLDGVETRLDRFAVDVGDRVGRTTKMGPFFLAVDRLVDRLADALAAANSSVNATSTVGDLAARLAEIRTNVSARVGSCNSTRCRSIRDATSTLRVVGDFASLPSSADVRAVLEGTRLENDLEQSRTNYDEMLAAVDNKSASDRAALMAEHDVILSNFSSFLNETVAEMEDSSLQHVTSYVSADLSPTIQRYGRYFYYGGLALSTMALVVDVLCFLGLLYGACGTLDDDKIECCQKAKARPILKLALGCAFAFSWIMMLAVGVLFPVGGIVHNDLCRNLLPRPPDPESARVVDAMLSNSMNLSWSVLGLYEHCENNGTIYEAFDLDEESGHRNLTAVLTADRYRLAEYVDRLKSAQYLTSTLEVIGTDLDDDLAELNSSITELRLDAYREQLEKPLLSGNLTELRNELAAVNYTASLAADVDAIQNGEYAAALNALAILNDSVAELESFRRAVNSAMASLDDARRVLSPDDVTKAAGFVADRLLDHYRDTFRQVRTHLAPCRSVGEDIARTRDGVCAGLLRPYNAFWFSAAWCLVVFVALVPNVLVLVDWFWPGRRPPDCRPSYPDETGSRPPAPYDGRPTDQARGKARIPYEHLPAITGARNSPLTSARNPHQQPARRYPPHHEQVAGDWDWQPDDDYRGSPRSLERQWTNLAYDDGYDRRPADVDDDDPRWRRQAREQYRGRYAAGYRGASSPNKYDDYRGNDRARRYDDSPIW